MHSQRVITRLNLNVKLEHFRLGRKDLQAEERVCACAQRVSHQGPEFLKRAKGRKCLMDRQPAACMELKTCLDEDSLPVHVCSD